MAKPWVFSLTLGHFKSPPQPVENRTIRDVLICTKGAAFSAGKATGEKGKLFGSFDAILREAKAARSLRNEHLIISAAILEKD